jgi:hypothetical protein
MRCQCSKPCAAPQGEPERRIANRIKYLCLMLKQFGNTISFQGGVARNRLTLGTYAVRSGCTMLRGVSQRAAYRLASFS